MLLARLLESGRRPRRHKFALAKGATGKILKFSGPTELRIAVASTWCGGSGWRSRKSIRLSRSSSTERPSAGLAGPTYS